MWVKDYMFSRVCTAKPDMTIKEAVRLMVDKKTNSLIIVDDDNKPVGTLSSYSLIKEVVPVYLQSNPASSQFDIEGTFDKHADKVKDKKIGDVIKGDVHKLTEDDAMIEAAAYALKSSKRLLAVVDKDGVLVGAITRTCIKNALYKVFYGNENE